ncbi:MAG: valine--tRNA ligase [Clostridia bacterium]|nr:valine--tRNA ligase [Clostridia bacterium]
MREIAKTYDPAQVESRLYDKWISNRYFHAEVNPDKKPFSIVMPPPNITGQLHTGHALDCTMQDILVRWKRMSGYETLWLPGTDHASIATEAKIVDQMAKEGISKDDLTREEFLERAWEWRRVYGGRIVEQLKKMGSSCDWDRERFTMDQGLSDAVTEVFCRLYDKGLIYRGERMSNWCPKCGTSISDIEVEYEDQAGSFWHLRYPYADGTGYLVVATTRPETCLGDTAVAVNPNDERYQHLIGKMLRLPLTDRLIPVIADEYVEQDFGTGCVKITPAHDPNDFEIGKRHNLDIITVIDKQGKMTPDTGKYAGMDRYEARKAIVADFEAQGNLEKVQPYTHNVGTCQRCGTTVEPVVSTQWYVKMKPLAEPAIDVVRTGKTKFVPDRFSKIYFNWMENIQDWCISRQLWWGHRIPAYYCADCGEIVVSKDAPTVCPKCGSTHLDQDPDTLDTWFSSALWPFSTMGWPAETDELKYFFPTDVLVTGYDIIFFWVARMIFSSCEQMGQEPFKYVMIHGLVRDAQGRKMSKSLGNGIDPLDIIDKYGTDALRFALVIGNAAGNDLRFTDEKVEAARNFCNKIWNAYRFTVGNFEENQSFDNLNPDNFTDADKWILNGLNNLVEEINSNMDKFEFGVALQKVYDFVWDLFCDWYIELAKPALYGDRPGKTETLYVLNKVLSTSMKLLHPFMPFITEEIYMGLVQPDESIVISDWPQVNAEEQFPEEADRMELVMTAIRGIRNIRAEMGVPNSTKANMIFVADSQQVRDSIKSGTGYFERLAGASAVIVQADKEGIPGDAVSVICDGCQVYIPLDQLIDISKEIQRLKKERDAAAGELQRATGKLNNPGFVAKAPAQLIEQEKEKVSKFTEVLAQLDERIEHLSNR